MSAISKGHKLASGQSLQLGECLKSPNGHYRLELQANDGNLVLYHELLNGGQRPTWATMKLNQGAHEVVMQPDGNLVVYKAGSHAPDNSIWASGTSKEENQDAYAELQNDGNFVVYRPGHHPIWNTSTWSHSHWMEPLADHLTLRDICVPGSHDAGMYKTRMLARDGLAMTQNQSLYQQLQAGSRYFDLRPHYIEGKGFYVYHGAADGPKLTEVIADVQRFFDEGSRETVILNFTNFDGWPKYPNTQEGWDAMLALRNLLPEFMRPPLPPKPAFHPQDKELVELIREPLKNYLLAEAWGTNLATLPLSSLRGRVLVLIENQTLYEQISKAFNYKGIYQLGTELKLYDHYADAQDAAVMQANQDKKLREFTGTDSLFVYNWTLTPKDGNWWQQTKTFFSSPSVHTLTERAHERLREAVKNWRDQPFQAQAPFVNILNLDYVEEADPVPICQRLIRERLAAQAQAKP